MKVLRSRKVLPAIGQKTSQPIASENGVFEPVTPAKSLETDNKLTESTSTISSSPQVMASQSGSRRRGRPKMVGGEVSVRRSARLAKTGGNEPEGSAEVICGKRKKVDPDSDGVSSCSEDDVDELVVKICSSVTGVEKLGPGNQEWQKSIGDMSVNRSDADKVEDSEATTGHGTTAYGEGTVKGRKQKRKLGKELKLLVRDSVGNDGLEEGYSNLRSGKKVLKRDLDHGSDGLFKKLDSGKECEIMLSGDALENDGVANIDEDGDDCSKGRKFSRAEKGKGKIGGQSYSTMGSATVNAVVGDGVKLIVGDSNSDASCLLKSSDPEDLAKETGSIKIYSGRRLSKEEKGKMKCKGEGYSANDRMKPDVKMLSSNDVSDSNQSVASTEVPGDIQVRETRAALNDGKPTYRERHRNIARRIASRFAHFSSQDELGDHAPGASAREIPVRESDVGPEDWPGPFSTAMKIIKDRESSRNEEYQFASPNKSDSAELKWIPVKQDQFKRPKQSTPLLQDLCLSVLAKNAESITSLECVPDMLRHKISWFLCDSRRMSSDFLELLVHGSPTEIRVRDCSWLSEELFAKIFADCILDNLVVLQFDQCGPCVPDYVLSSTLARSPGSLAALTTLSLKGAYRLTDEGLKMLVSSAPNLKSVDLSQCPMVTSDGICSLAISLRLVLMELYMDNCDRIDAMLILPALLMLQNLEVLSLAGFQTVTDQFVIKIVSAHGCRMKEIVLADCTELTDLSLEAIGKMCPGLNALDLTKLCKLTDVGICHIANGCCEIQTLKLCRGAFSDEAVAAYLDIRGSSLKELSLNSVIKVSSNTALSIARNCRNLQRLDISWCRKLTNEALGIIVDTCTSLEFLKLFGCSQVTSVFLDGYSNPRVKLMGLKLTSVVQHLEVPDFLQGPLRYSSA